MEPVKVSLPDGSEAEFEAGLTLAQAAQRLSRALSGRALAAEVNGRRVDLGRTLGELQREAGAAPAGAGQPQAAAPAGAPSLRFLTFEDEGGREVMRHSAAHVLAQAVKHLFPGARLAIGPAIEDGFYYDFDVPQPFQPQDLEGIEAEMHKLIEADQPLERSVVSREEAARLFAGEPYKLELVADLPQGQPITCYRQGDFLDLCAGPHLPSTGRIKAVKLLSAAGAYWRGDERRPMLQRIYGTAFESRKDLEEHLAKVEEAARRDHRRLGRELDLFSFHAEVGPGLVHWHPRGGVIRSLVEDLWRRQHRRHGYDLVYSPHIGKAQLWEASGHLGFYRENMYAPMLIDGQEYFIKPMNCPFHIMMYKERQRSYRDLPLRFAELGTVYRYERSGVLHGLLRVRGFTQDDAHIFCRPDQIESEIAGCLDFMLELWRGFGFEEFAFMLSTRPEKFVGSEEDWERATQALGRALEAGGREYRVDPGAGVFYGPKIDIHVKDALGRFWQCTTIQFDFNLPERFGMEFTGQDGKERRPFMVHRTLLGSMERFLGILTEHYAGAFPLWLAPVQARVLPVTDRNADYARRVQDRLRAGGARVDRDERNETMSYRVRAAQLEKVPYMLVVGDREAAAGAVAVRHRLAGDQGPVELEAFAERLRVESLPPDAAGAR